MTVTLGTLRADLRAHLDEATATFWTDAQLNTWINDGLRDLARRTETLDQLTAVPVAPGTGQYTMPSNVVRVHRVEFDQGPGAGPIYPLEARQFYEMDSLWGTWRTQQQSYPSYFALFGFPPNLVLYVWPIPSQAGNLNVFYHRLPAQAVNDTDVLDVPEGWWDLVVLFGEYQALRKDADPRFTDAKALYDEKVGEMTDRTRRWHDQAGYVSSGRSWVPWDLYGGGEW